jgi:hypothetical protein
MQEKQSTSVPKKPLLPNINPFILAIHGVCSAVLLVHAPDKTVSRPLLLKSPSASMAKDYGL